MKHVPGKFLYTADALSQAPIHLEKDAELEEVEHFVEGVVSTLPLPQEQLDVYHQARAEDPVCALAFQKYKSGWVKEVTNEGSLGLYWQARNALTIQKNLLLFNNRIVVPPPYRRTP